MNSNPDNIASTQATKPDVLRIDVDAVLRERAARYYRYMPRFIIRSLEHLVRQDRLNRLLEENAGREGADFCSGVLRHLDVQYRMADGHTLPSPSKPRVILVSNHPLGGLDGMALIDMVARHYGREPRFLVNDLLMAVKPLRGVFLPVNKHGRQNRNAADAIHSALESDAPIIIFPAGLVSRRKKGGAISDLKWQKKFIDLARQYHRDIVPLHFSGRNSDFFYKFAQWRERLGIKFNIEMVLLPRELFLCSGCRFTIKAGEPIPCDSALLQKPGREAASEIRELIYRL